MVGGFVCLSAITVDDLGPWLVMAWILVRKTL